ncbi:MAG: MarR family transcriptional regulator [Lachnospiraceae bacterium]|jgi:DNA-binding MarR family transcriptional regulator|uniref:MarR family winged helix-turn-helix transcriptional regulator n=1 Tax=Clostridium sp. (strain SY8519) TaxID=1042156 RepID=UPI0002D3B8A1|nr:MarR family transcriptional regulator [Clostridium sp. SY8519]MCI1653970.1 MarR family transcriptional regulator [Lachnospiraceae bacterium]MCI1656121.1 MarR family transcriptional regulator [Lachnospiraceae bacterium]MCI2194603.1 MarR family transcriptional regulator [Lachnospiraceae bacterium]
MTQEYNPDEALKLENQLCFPLYAAARLVTGRYTPYLKPLGLTYTQYIVFLVLWEQDGISMGELGSKLFLDNGTLTPLVKKMEKAGYVTRSRSEEDERVVLISLTDQGRAMKEKVKNIPLELAGCLHMRREDMVRLHDQLYRILKLEES